MRLCEVLDCLNFNNKISNCVAWIYDHYFRIHVHLGKYYSDKYENCKASNVCAHPTVTVDIEEAIKHEVSELNDIALIRLSRVVHYTDFIKPISLPSELGLVSSSTNTNLSIAGWGKGNVNRSRRLNFK